MTDGVPEQQQQPPGVTALMEPTPDHGEESYVGTAVWRARRRSSRAATAASAARSRSPSRARAPTF